MFKFWYLVALRWVCGLAGAGVCGSVCYMLLCLIVWLTVLNWFEGAWFVAFWGWVRLWFSGFRGLLQL